MDPDAVLMRAACKLVRRQYYAGGPNEVWASDGHDKLLPFGIAIYGFIDCWSRKILGLHAHVTNSDPRHVDLWYLGLVKKHRGIPRKLTTDRGTETVDLAGHQIYLGQTYGSEVPDWAYHRYVKSTRNQKIECFWDKMICGLTGNIKDSIQERIDQGLYDSDDPMSRSRYFLLRLEIHTKLMSYVFVGPCFSISSCLASRKLWTNGRIFTTLFADALISVLNYPLDVQQTIAT